MSTHSLIDNVPVPCSLSPQQVQVLFPAGVAGLRSLDGEYVFPNENGTISLVPLKKYCLKTLVCASVPPSPNGGERKAVATPNGESAAAEGASSRSGGTGHKRSLDHFQSPDASPRVRIAATVPPAFSGFAPCTPHVANSTVQFPDEDDEPPARKSSLTRNYEPRQGKLILDRVHEHLMLPMLVFDIIDTPEFQRLRGLKQLGTTSYLYPGATHTRFEHCIGVAHLAGLMAKKIARRQPELNITDEDILCVTVAGLCHDLGHGPFSHLFEVIVNRNRSEKNQWHHETMSVCLLRRVLSRIPLDQYNLREEDANFIALCINGLRAGAPWPSNVGRTKEKRFLADIVSNKRSGIDVDKLDYFMRDSLCCYGRSAVDCHIPRLLAACKVLCFENEYQICFEEKLALSLGDIFTLRAKLHKYAYQHRIVKVMDHMITDVLAAADPYFHVKGKDGKPTRISECVDDPEGFIELGDWIIHAMAASPDPNMAKAQAILHRINDRDLYTVAGMAMFARHQHKTSAHLIKEEILGYIDDEVVANKVRQSMIVDFVKITYGSSDSEGNPDDPINNVTFYNPKSSTPQAFKLPRARQSPLFSPTEFGEKSVIIIVRDREYTALVCAVFSKWREHQTRNLGVEVPVYNLSPARAMMKRMRDGSVTNYQRSNVNAIVGGSNAALFSRESASDGSAVSAAEFTGTSVPNVFLSSSS